MSGTEEVPEAFIFDLFGVLITAGEAQTYRRLADSCAEPDRAARAIEGLLSGLSGVGGRQQMLVQAHSLLVENLGLKLSLDEFMNALAAPVTAFMPGMADLLDALRPRYRLLMLSNIDAESFEEIRRDHPALDGFDALLTSGATGLAKPDRAAFENACKVAGAAPERCYFIDDAARHVEAARQLGIRGHVFSGSPALLTDLRSIGVAGLEGLA